MSGGVFGTTSTRSGFMFRWNEPDSISITSTRRDVAAVVAFCAVGLIASLLFICVRPDSFSGLIALMP